jgi:hypothetical protein
MPTLSSTSQQLLLCQIAPLRQIAPLLLFQIAPLRQIAPLNTTGMCLVAAQQTRYWYMHPTCWLRQQQQQLSCKIELHLQQHSGKAAWQNRCISVTELSHHRHSPVVAM